METLNDQVVEAARLEPRQHGHLRAALDLEHTDGVGALKHLVDRRLVFGALKDGSQGGRLQCSSIRSKHFRMAVNMPSESRSTFTKRRPCRCRPCPTG